MGEPRISNILVGVLLMALVIAGVTSFIAAGVSKYGGDDYNASTLEQFSSVAYDIENITIESEGNLSEVKTAKFDSPDIFGGFFSKSWSAFKTLGKSIGVFFNIIDYGTEELPLDVDYSQLLKTVLMTIVIVIVVIGIFFHFISKSSRL